jgi:hypothetical protein
MCGVCLLHPSQFIASITTASLVINTTFAHVMMTCVVTCVGSQVVPPPVAMCTLNHQHPYTLSFLMHSCYAALARCFGQALALVCLITRWPALLAKLFFLMTMRAAGEAPAAWVNERRWWWCMVVLASAQARYGGWYLLECVNTYCGGWCTRATAAVGFAVLALEDCRLQRSCVMKVALKQCVVLACFSQHRF